MFKTSSGIILSATDLAFFMGCNHATWLDLQEAHGKLKAPHSFFDPSLDALRLKGQAFENEYINRLENTGKRIAKISRNRITALNDTIQAMKDGADIIYQARLEQHPWNGWADFLVKVDKPGNFGNWSYEVEDTKFAKHTKAGSILQICLYSYMLTALQGVQPEHMHIRTPDGNESYRVDDFMAYFRLMQKRMLEAIVQTDEITYPHPVEQCEICKWWVLCNKRRREDDHLGFIAGMGAAQIREVNNWHIKTLESMAELSLPIRFDPLRGNVQTYTKLREQARLQLQARVEKRNVYELLPLQQDFGFYKLPEPSDGDIFFDFEGDPFIGNSGREYLFGWVHKKEYNIIWATTDKEEKDAFEQFIDTVMSIWKQYPGMHIYHFSPYEPSALKRLMGKYATKEDEVDRLLRANVFTDLHTIVRHSIRAGVESYSLKELEKMHAFERSRDLKLVGQHKALFEGLLENDNADAIDDETKEVVKDYNRDDCLSAESLRDWLEKLRSELIQNGQDIPRPPLGEGDPGESVTDHQRRIRPIFDALIKDIPFERKERSNEEQARWLLANMLDWYRREMKSFWWEFFRLRGLDDEDLLNEKGALSGLKFTGDTGIDKKSIVHYYSFPAQESELKIGTDVDYNESMIGSVSSLDMKNLRVGIKKNKKSAEIHPSHIIGKDLIEQEVKEEAIISLAEWVMNNGIDADGNFRAARDLLLNKVPRTSADISEMENAQEKAVQWVLKLDRGVLPVQGPPGTGKSHTAARMIIALIKEGKKVGITALSHKVISGLLQKVVDAALENNVAVQIVQKVSGEPNNPFPNWIETKKYEEISGLMQSGANVIAGTSFMWARPAFAESVDVLFVDEAGQLSLIDTLALSHSGKNLVLLGDPQQLQQPQKGSHPEGTEVSALAHILGDEQTISSEKGVFLDKTWRMHPNICGYVSELFYRKRLFPMEKNANQKLTGNTRYGVPGMYVHTVKHSGNSNSSAEEAEAVRIIVKDLLESDEHFYDYNNALHKLNADCIKVITPYNAQVNAISALVPHVQTGTVDKFQGQEAQVIIFSMATSTPQDAPRGMEFLYSLNRLNVAVSRARTVFILVASPALFEPDCRSPHQMKLANALCRLVEKSIE